MKIKNIFAIIFLVFSAALSHAITVDVYTTAGDRVLVWNFTTGEFACRMIVAGQSYRWELAASEDDFIIVYQTDRSCYSDYGRIDFRVDDPEGLYEADFTEQ